MPSPLRNLVLDTEAASALLSDQPVHPKRAAVVEAVMAANGATIVPTAVRSEAQWRRADPPAADANRLVPQDDPLDRVAADRNVLLQRNVPTASLVDAAVGVAAERSPASDVVEILTSDVDDLRALADHLDRRVEIGRV